MASLRGHERQEFHPLVKDFRGKTFGSWKVLGRAENKYGRTVWFCRCECGLEKNVLGCHLASRKSTNCGCLKPRGDHHPRFKHGQTDSQLHAMWMGMHARCRRDGRDASIYKDRGIAVCERWNDFSNFVLDMGPRPSVKHSIDRIDNSKGYFPDNCRWALPKQQMRNMRRNRIVEYRGRQMSLAEAAELAGVNYDTAKWRIDHGHAVDGAAR